MTLAAAAALSVWLLRSPLLALHEVSIHGIDRTEVDTILAQAGVIEGRPLVSIKPNLVEEALLSDPRVKQVEAFIEWPQRIVIEVIQRRPVAWAAVGEIWALVGSDGIALARADRPASGFPRLEVGWQDEPTAEAMGALAFLSELDPVVGARTTLIAAGGELWALIDGVNVRLGRPVDMESKARALEAVLVEGVPPNATINLIAPARPAVSVTTSTTVDSQSQPEP